MKNFAEQITLKFYLFFPSNSFRVLLRSNFFLSYQNPFAQRGAAALKSNEEKREIKFIDKNHSKINHRMYVR